MNKIIFCRIPNIWGTLWLMPNILTVTEYYEYYGNLYRNIHVNSSNCRHRDIMVISTEYLKMLPNSIRPKSTTHCKAQYHFGSTLSKEQAALLARCTNTKTTVAAASRVSSAPCPSSGTTSTPRGTWPSAPTTPIGRSCSPNYWIPQPWASTRQISSL